MTKIADSYVTTLEDAKNLGVTQAEYQHVCKKLERNPSYAELGIFSAMFSEHCSYKSSKKYLRKFPTKGKRVLQGPGENAGVVDIGGGWAVAFKMESHNHPSFIEPYQGAATGVGGILRDVFTMGARPIASMNGLCFGSLHHGQTARIAKGVVKGIGDYGNCVGVPTVAGQTLFHSCYQNNPLVNAFTLGLVRHEDIFKGVAEGVGNLVIYIGAKTGRDGVHGATMASKEFSSGEELERPTVQVGDPFTEKLLLEATLEVMKKRLVVGIQDMGAAGLTSSSFEMAHRSGTGLEIDLDKIPCRESQMTGYELLLSESQERMLAVIDPKNWDELQSIFEKWDLHSENIGQVTNSRRVVMFRAGDKIVDLPVELVVEPLEENHPAVAPSDLRQRWFMDGNRLLSATLVDKINAVLEDPNFCDLTPLVEQYDCMVGNRTLGGSFDDAAMIRIRDINGKNVRLAMTTDCNSKVTWLWPKEGGRRAICEAALNLAVRGAEAIGVTDCLNFGSPENSEVMWQFSESVDGISEACVALQIPVISGNVSLYNETDGKPIYPTPMIGMVGLIEDDFQVPQSQFYSTELEIAVLGPLEGGLGGSSLASQWFKRDCGQPEETDLKVVERALKFCQKVRRKKSKFALHDISDGGLIVALLEMAFRGSHLDVLGLELQLQSNWNMDRVLFGETIPRLILAYDPIERTEMEMLSTQHGLAFQVVGQTNDGSSVVIKQGGAVIWDQKINKLRENWKTKLISIFE